MKKHCSLLLLFVLSIAGACVAQSGDGSLGDLARNARMKQKAVMVFNDDNMQRSAVTDNDTGSASAASGAGQDAKNSHPDTSSADAKDKKKDESKSAKSNSADDNVSRLRKQLDSLKQEQSVWSNSARNYEEKLANDTDDFRRQMDQEALDNDKNNVQVYQRKIDQTQSELEKAQQEQGASKPESSKEPPTNP
jgi:hypothetical protein